MNIASPSLKPWLTTAVNPPASDVMNQPWRGRLEGSIDLPGFRGAHQEDRAKLSTISTLWYASRSLGAVAGSNIGQPTPQWHFDITMGKRLTRERLLFTSSRDAGFRTIRINTWVESALTPPLSENPNLNLLRMRSSAGMECS
jgi:hypothetical protein